MFLMHDSRCWKSLVSEVLMGWLLVVFVLEVGYSLSLPFDTFIISLLLLLMFLLVYMILFLLS